MKITNNNNSFGRKSQFHLLQKCLPYNTKKISINDFFNLYCMLNI